LAGDLAALDRVLDVVDRRFFDGELRSSGVRHGGAEKRGGGEHSEHSAPRTRIDRVARRAAHR
jgi:hypothetical protein